MRRREFLSSTVAASAVARAASGKALPKRPYKDGVELSVIGLGGIVVVGLEQGNADRMVAESFDRGVNYYDVAPTYADGEAEQKLGIALKPYRSKSFLACKTTMRDAARARQELERSLKRLHTDHFDLYQFHAVSSMDDVNQIAAPRGAAEMFLKARQEGKVKYLGFSAHSAEAAIALMDRLELDSILFPVNYVCYAQGNFGPQILAKAKEKGMARLALKAMAQTTIPKGAPHSHKKCWYTPVSDPKQVERALRFTLSEDITAAIPPGDEGLYQMALDAAAAYRPITAKERAELLASAKGVEPIFRA
ncbi:MAG: aldo/keto reductase [Bryobacteraceae bacterium]|nr:aldo/keto reductase [Bryobacteraceae bacterium]